MDRDTILSLTGPALSEAVAEHVMGWQRLSQAAVVEQRGSTWADAKGDWHLIPHGPALRPGDAGLFAIVAEVWEPHQDMRAAWQVFENRRMQRFSQRTAFFLHLGRLLQDGKSQDESLCVAWPDAMMFLDAPTICKAALSAVESRREFTPVSIPSS